MYEGKELSGHRKLVDIGLVNGDKLEVKAIRTEKQEEEKKDNRL